MENRYKLLRCKNRNDWGWKSGSKMIDENFKNESHVMVMMVTMMIFGHFTAQLRESLEHNL